VPLLELLVVQEMTVAAEAEPAGASCQNGSRRDMTRAGPHKE